MEVDFRWYFSDTYGSPLSGTIVTEVTPLLRKSLISYKNHSSLTEITYLLRKLPSTIEVTYKSQFKLRKSTFGCAIFMLFTMVYGSPLSKFILVYGSPLPSSYGLRKLTSKIKSLAKVDFGFVVYVSSIDIHRSILQSTKLCLYL